MEITPVQSPASSAASEKPDTSYSNTHDTLSASDHNQTEPVSSLDDSLASPYELSSVDWQSRVLSVADYLALPRDSETWLIEPLLPTGGSLLLYGDPKVGKSFAALQMAACLTSANDWLGFGIQSACKVLYIQLDTARSLWVERVEQLLFSTAGLEYVLMADRGTLGCWPFDILEPSHEALLRAIVSGFKPDVVIMDTLRECHSGDENDSTPMQGVIAHLTAAVNPAALVLVSHSRKSNPEHGYDLINDNRGSNYIVSKMDGIVRMTHTTIRVSGRAIDEQSIGLERLDNGLWEVAYDPLKDKLGAVVATGLSTREMAKMLHTLVPSKSESACRAYLRRHVKPA